MIRKDVVPKVGTVLMYEHSENSKNISRVCPYPLPERKPTSPFSLLVIYPQFYLYVSMSKYLLLTPSLSSYFISDVLSVLLKIIYLYIIIYIFIYILYLYISPNVSSELRPDVLQEISPTFCGYTSPTFRWSYLSPTNCRSY